MFQTNPTPRCQPLSARQLRDAFGPGHQSSVITDRSLRTIRLSCRPTT